MTYLERFTKAERLLHWSSASAVFLLLGTGALIWQHLDEWEIAEINVISQFHVWGAGLLLMATLVGFALWRRRRVPSAAKRFNPGQRAGLRVVQGLVGFLIASGVVLYAREFVTMAKPFKALVRELHLIGAGAIAAFVLAHLVMVFLVPKNRGLLQGMVTGRVPRDVAERVSPRWLAEQDHRPGERKASHRFAERI